jgi:hypothetical protein
MIEKQVHAGQSDIRLGLVIAAPVLGRVEMVPTALLHDCRCNNTAVSATKPVAAATMLISRTIIRSRSSSQCITMAQKRSWAVVKAADRARAGRTRS